MRRLTSFCVATCTGQHDEPFAHFLHESAPAGDAEERAVPAEEATPDDDDDEAPSSSTRADADAGPGARGDASSALDDAAVAAHSSSMDVVVDDEEDAPRADPRGSPPRSSRIAPRPPMAAIPLVALPTCAARRSRIQQIGDLRDILASPSC